MEAVRRKEVTTNRGSSRITRISDSGERSDRRSRAVVPALARGMPACKAGVHDRWRSALIRNSSIPT
jgi:hypothetical protein